MQPYSFKFQCPTLIKFGIGCRSYLIEYLNQKKLTEIGIVLDASLQELTEIKTLTEAIVENGGKVVQVLYDSANEPTYNYLEELRGAFNGGKCEVMIGIGGGSAMDTAKAMAVLVHNQGPALQYRGFDKMTQKVLPVIAIPTTAGTGSEITPNASFVDSDNKKKLGINGEAIRPCLALIDPELTASCPRRATISAAVDSIVHAVESYVSKSSNPVSRIFAAEGFGMVVNHLEAVLENGSDLDARSQVMYGAFFAAMGLMHAGTGPAAALSYPLGVHKLVPHGLAGAIFLPVVVQYNLQQGVNEYAGLYRKMHGCDLGLREARQAEAFASRLRELWERVGIPRRLSEVGVGAQDLDLFVADTMELKGALDQNPVLFGEKQIRQTLLFLQ